MDNWFLISFLSMIGGLFILLFGNVEGKENKTSNEWLIILSILLFLGGLLLFIITKIL